MAGKKHKPADSPAQLELFAPEAPPPPPELDWARERELALRLPPHVLFGTSSWTFPGWGGIVYPGRPTERELLARGLEAYARYPLFRTVGIDRSYYAPLSTADLASYAAQLPDGFRCVQKVFSGITTRADPRTGELVRTFLDPGAFEDLVAGPVRQAFAAHAGPLVLEFPPMRATVRPPPGDFADLLDRFLDRIPEDLDYAVELRNRELLTPRYLDVLRAHGVAHVLNLWERMPDVGEQLSIGGILTAPFVVARLLIKPGRRYADEKSHMAPFDRIVEQDPKMRDDVVALAEACAALGKVLLVIVNNKVEGSSPLTIRALAERLARARDGARKGSIA